MRKHTHIVASNALSHSLTVIDLAGYEYLVAIRLIAPWHDVT